MAAAQGKQVYVLYVRNAFQNTIQFNASKRTCYMLPPFFSENIGLHWPDILELNALTVNPKQYAIQNNRSMQGEKDASQKWYQLFSRSLANVGMRRSVADHAVSSWRTNTPE
jgi:hypothetical protein